MRIIEELVAHGHRNVIASHPTTFEITKDHELTKRGDCVIAVGATKGPRDLSMEFRKLCMKDESRIVVELRMGAIVDFIEGRGSRRLTLTHASEIVGRKSSYTSDRTVMIRADKAACDIDKGLVEALKLPNAWLKVRMTVET